MHGDYTEAFVSYDRRAVLRVVAQDAGTRLEAVVDLALAALRARWAAEAVGDEAKRRAATELLSRAADRLDDVLREGVDGANADQRAAARFWRGRLALEQDALMEANDKALSAERDHAVNCFDNVANMNDVSSGWRVAAEGWLAVAKGRPWPALHDALTRSSNEKDLFEDELTAALFDVAGRPTVPNRLELRLSDKMLPDDAVQRLIARAPDAKSTRSTCRPSVTKSAKKSVSRHPLS